MAFATNTAGTAAGNNCITEKDLVRQVASNITKEAIVVSKTSNEGTAEKIKGVADPKRLM